MNVNRILLIIFIIPIISFSQKRDVYFILKDNNPEYVITTSNGKFTKKNVLDKFKFIYLSFRKEFEKQQMKIEENKKKGIHYGISDLDSYPRIPSLDFEVKSRKKIKLNHLQLTPLWLVDFEWLKKNSWKKIGKQSYDFRATYFLYKIEKDTYISYKVEMTVIEY